MVAHSSSVRVNKPFFWGDCYKNGLLYVHQLFSDKMYKSFDQVNCELGLTKLRYNSLKSALPGVENFLQN